MTVKKRRKRWNVKEHSRYKMQVYFYNRPDTEACTFYSFDWRSGYSKRLDPAKGLKGLQDKVKKYGKSARLCLIYDRISNALIERYFEGELIE